MQEQDDWVPYGARSSSTPELKEVKKEQYG